MSEEIKHMRDCYDDDNQKKQKHENFEISFKVRYRSLALSIADIFSCFCEEKALSLQSCSALAKRRRKILIKKLRFTHKQQENEARGERYSNTIKVTIYILQTF
jgi:hypothetical protein